MRAVHIRTEYLDEPLGLGNRHPRFFWNCEKDDGDDRAESVVMKVSATKQEGEAAAADGKEEPAGRAGSFHGTIGASDPASIQSAYRITAEEIAPDGSSLRTVWDSGKVQSSDMTGIPYEGEMLKSRERIRLSITLWDGNDVAGETVSSDFEMGLLEPEDWSASWIGGRYHPKKNIHYPVDYFGKKFTASDVIQARLYASARGLYDVTLNGQRLEDQVLTPGITDYRKRIQYQTFDVTKLIQNENHILIRLADGWYRGSCAAYGVMDVYGTKTSVLAQLELTHSDGNVEVIGTDGSWGWSNEGPLRFADLKDGEVYDARLHPHFQQKAKVVKAPDAPLVSSDNVPIRMKEHFPAKLLISETGKKVLDFGQNLAGWLEFSLEGKNGQKLVLTLGEVLDEKGDVDLHGVQETRPAGGWGQMSLVKKLLGRPLGGKTVMTPEQKIVYICKDGINHYRTSFSVFGFRYAEVEGDISIDPENFQSIAVYSDMEETGEYTCSNELVNQLVRNTRWSMKSNFLDIPTDCPTRERLGWTGDAQIFFNTGAYFMNTAPFFAKWLQDMEDSQYKNGVLPAVLPYEGVEMMYKATGTSVGWADAVYLVPWRYYLMYGDRKVLERCWPMIRKYSDYLLKHTGLTDRKAAKNNPYNQYTYEKGVHLGEWLEPEEFRDKVYGASAKHPEECTAYFHYSMKTIAKIADILGKDDYAKKLREYADGSKKAYDYLIVGRGFLDTDRQAKLVRPLALGLLDKDEKKKAEERLLEAVRKYRYRVGTGFLSTPFLLRVLSDAGYGATAYRVLENEERPGWLSEVKAGATTIWENWEGNLSQNHYSPGSVCEWLFSTSAGIRVSGNRHFTIAPLLDESLDFVSASYQSIYGRVSVSWKKTQDGYEVKVSLPCNTRAEVALS